MITATRERSESRKRDRKRKRVRLTIGGRAIRLTPEEAYKLGSRLLSQSGLVVGWWHRR